MLKLKKFEMVLLYLRSSLSRHHRLSLISVFIINPF
nr:MAG TPA: hypothetical protein [Caudoviricetes sp.]DAY75893.1 MAG TPA: hypothetical protein [Caudoviricetes sp.]